MTRIERRYIAIGFASLMAWLTAIAMGAASVDRASYQECITAGGTTLYCSQGYQPYQE
ncbi:hypothetical protein ACUN8C_05730 [Kushneria sp. Sum13]|uniref:hypothetical protein n=1 Tax=Kushneria sp. Sum13 TaxID=3459196 RepID=UPI004045A801